MAVSVLEVMGETSQMPAGADAGCVKHKDPWKALASIQPYRARGMTNLADRSEHARLRHGVAREVPEQHHDPEAVRAMLGHTRIDTTQTDARMRPAPLKRAVEFYEGKAVEVPAD